MQGVAAGLNPGRALAENNRCKASRMGEMGGGGPCCEEIYLQSHDANLSYSPLLSTANIRKRLKGQSISPQRHSLTE